MKKRYLIIGAAVTILAAIIVFMVWKKSGLDDFLGWKLNHKYIYALNYSGSNSNMINVPGEKTKVNYRDFAGEFSYEIDVAYTPFKKEGDIYFMRLNFENPEKISYKMKGTELFNDPMKANAIYLGRTAVVKIDSTGKIHELLFKKGEDLVFKGTIKLLLGDLQIALLKKSRSWSADEKTQYGNAAVKYKIVEKAFSSVKLEKKRTEYSEIKAVKEKLEETDRKVSSLYDINIIPGRHIVSMEGEENVSVVNNQGVTLFAHNSSIKFSLKDIVKLGNISAVSLQKTHIESTALGAIDTNKKMENQIFRQQAQNMTHREMLDTLEKYSTDGKIYNKGLFWWRSSAYLKLHPERSEDLIAIFTKKGFSSKARTFIVGLLAYVGHEKAQEVMRKLVRSEASKNDHFHSIFYQNFSLIKNPAPETLKMVENLYKESKETRFLRTSTKLVYGSMAGNLHKAGRTKDALAINTILVDDLMAADNDRDREDLLNALSNVSIEENIEVAEKFLGSEDERVRASVANAVRYTQSEKSEEIVSNLLSDKSEIVQRQALGSFNQYKLRKEHLESIYDKINNDEIRSNIYTDTLQLLIKYPKEKNSVKKALETMKVKGVSNAHLESRINTILRGI